MSAFSARHYNFIANILREATESSAGLNGEEAIRHVTLSLADAFEDDNERFDKDRFVEASTWGQE